MFFQLLRELPHMFVIAAIIWLVAGYFIIKTFRNKRLTTPPKKFIVTIATVLCAILLTAIDVWLFVFFIPTHFKNSNTQLQPATISTADIANDVRAADSNKTSSQPNSHTDSLKNTKTATLKPEAKIYATNHASVTFISHGEDEDIEAGNPHSAIAFNNVTGDIKVVAFIKGFQFENQLMQSHFNEPAYMNSDAYPKSEFKGKINYFNSIDISKNNNYPINVTGRLTIHGITKSIIVKGTLTVSSKKISVQSAFTIKRADYGITTNEIADELQITVKGTLQ